MKIFIDAGHNYSGGDTGASENGIREQDVTFHVAKHLEKLFLSSGHSVKMSRNNLTDNLGKTTNESLTLRYKMANDWGADFFISLHCNSNENKTANGTETLISARGGQAEKLATAIQSCIVNDLKTVDRGVRVDNEYLKYNLAVLEYTNMPAILVEMGFISNSRDAEILKNNQYELAWAIYNGFCDYSGVKVEKPTSTNALAQKMFDDKVTTDLQYWSKVFNGEESMCLDYFKTIIERYSNLVRGNPVEDNKEGSKNEKFVLFNNTYIFPIDISKFKIKYFDKAKRSGANIPSYFNLGYFGNFAHNKTEFTLPAANLVADIDVNEIPEVVLPYLKERKIANGKFYMSTNQNAGAQFKNKKVSTLIIENGVPRVEKISEVQDSYQYTVSGVPIMLNGKKTTDYTSEGWQKGVGRATYHSCLGIKDKKLYYFPIYTTSVDCISSGEIYDKVKGFGFTDVLKMDGGGSAYFKFENEVQVNTSENRQINTIGIIG
ncbi:MAG: N-acetylmuramoyl-L-alanine amidase [Clostridia bacterium]|nr:N-acetylmuramoyl-L-alanine amidase [Clostridia bacterium]